MPRRFYALLTLTLLVGAFLRLWQLTAVPPGLHYDLAATALLGNEVAFHGYRPLFITAFTGHEALFYYWLALWFRLIGSSIFALRLAAATLGLLTLAATFFAVRELLWFEEQSHLLAIFAAVLLAVAFFHVAFSRFGFRAITEPLIQALALGFLFRGLRKAQGTGSKGSVWILDFGVWNLLLSGAFAGLAAYTYLAARFFPIPLAVFWLALFFASRSSLFASRFALFAASALLTVAPLGLYFWQHPDDFLNRVGQVAPRAGEGALVWQGLRRAAEMIFVSGETYDRYNLPGLPLLYPLLGAFFVIGFIITIRRCFTAPSRQPVRWATEVMLMAWLPAMLLPTALAVRDIFPSTIRALGVAPLLFVFPARGIMASFRWLQKYWPGPLLPTAYPLTWLAAAALVIGAWVTANNYFGVWANLPGQRLNNDADLTAIADYVNAQELSGTAVFVSSIHYRHPTLAYLARDFQSIHWLTGGASLAIPAQTPALYVFARSAPLPEDWLAAWQPFLVEAPSNQDFRAYRFESGVTPPQSSFESTEANFSNLATLTGYHFIPQADRLLVDVRWRVENVPEVGDFLPYARLYDSQTAWTQSGGFSYPSEQWVVGDTVLARLSIPLPAGLPPGAYRVKVGFYSANTDANFAHLDDAGQYAGQTVSLPLVELAGGPAMALEDFLAINLMQAPQENGFTAGLQLLGYTFNTTAPRQGERVWLTLFWRASEAAAAPAQYFTLGDYAFTTPFPVAQFGAGQVLIQHLIVHVPPEQAPGATPLRLDVPGFGSAALAALEVQPVGRTFTAPQPAAPTAYRLGEAFALTGYDLTPGLSTHLTLHWQSLAPTEADYTVFVHVRDANGVIAAQSDAAPRHNTYPTSQWAAHEYVSDDYAFELGSGTYTVEVGLYTPDDGARLPVRNAAGNKTGNVITLPEFRVP